MANQKLQALFNAIPGGIAIYELSDTIRIKQYGDWACKFTGYESNEAIEEVRQGSALATIWPDDLEKAKKEFERIRCGEVNETVLSVRIKCKDGTPKRVNIHGSVIERTPSKVTMYAIYIDGR